jgi:AAA domain
MSRVLSTISPSRDGHWSGRADVLRRVETPSGLGAWSYEVTDTKLARETKGNTVLQLSLYSDLLATMQQKVPETAHVVTPGTEYLPEAYRVADFAAFYGRIRRSLVIAPYNAQVFELQERIPGARIGTVDKFQGQEAPIVIYSMTTSSHADAPRGMEFLYSLNRLNVATSRAKCLCILIASPRVFEAECRTPRRMQLANAFCRYLEMALPL